MAVSRASYRGYGLEIETDFPFSAALEGGRGAPDLYFLSGLERGVRPELEGPPAYASRLKHPEGRPWVELWRDGDREFLSFTGRTAFFIDRSDIRYCAADDPVAVEGLFLSSVLAYVLECRGVLALHGSAIDVDGAGVCFLAPSGMGKSSLAAAFVAAGHSLLADDVVALEGVDGAFLVRPAFPQISLDEEVGSLLRGVDLEALSPVDPLAGKRRWRVARSTVGPAAAVALRGAFVLRRSDDFEHFERRSRLSRLDASLEILRAGFTPNLAEAAGLAPDRLDRISQLVSQVPVTRLDYRSSIGGLPRLVEAILGDLPESRQRRGSTNVGVESPR